MLNANSSNLLPLQDAVNVILHDNEIFIFHKRFLAGKFCCAVEKVGVSERPYTASFILYTLSECDRITFTISVDVKSKNLDAILTSGKFLARNDKLLKIFISNGKLALHMIMSNANLKNKLFVDCNYRRKAVTCYNVTKQNAF